MGVFARFFRRSKATEETRVDEVRTGEARDGAAAAEPGAKSSTGTAEVTAPAGAPKTGGPAVEETDEVTGTDGVGIPKQQSAGASDSESGKGART